MQKIRMLFVLILLSVSVFSQEDLEEVKITKKQKGIKKSYTLTANTSVITSKELLKAACCNLAESFETNPSIDVNFSDALTGTKQIKMLGLTSPYLMITEENIPSVRGASQAYGLSFTPGTWIESVQITKGAGSVINGYESISGQINTELLKPLNDIPFFLNFYGSTDSRFELNTHFNKKLSDKWATSLFVHGNARVAKNDMNDDGFLDNPLGKQINILNRYQYYNAESGLVSFINFRYMNDKKQTGQVDFDKDRDRGTTNFWGSEINTERFEVSAKVGYVFPDMPYQSIGFQNAFNSHNQDSYFGLNLYDIKQNSYYSNLIFNSIINNTMHKFSTGLNFTYDEYQEFVNVNDYSRIDNSVGAFFEYTYDNTDNFSLILGGRVDNHNRLGFFVTPRLHMRYNPWKDAVIRFSAGRGKRSANIFAENQQLFASSRTFEILDANGKIYGLNPEIAWNYGWSFSQKFKIFGKNADAGFDFYRTDFQNQAVVDLMQSPQQVSFYNLRGNSFANSLQLEFNYEVLHNFNLRTAYKYYDIQTDYLTGTFQRPLQAKHRFLGNLEYETNLNDDKQWKFDFTYNWSGKQQLPYTAYNPEADQFPDFSPSYAVMNAQVTRVFSSVFEVYVGGENIGNYKQEKAILGANDPFGSNFDASIAYAPIFGQMYYAGLRFKIK
ncbi:TonB-dependent receptor [Flavobacterium sp. Fl-77]|uniref:TonB-dependent receptor n=1 Tax=Flavobacterium flavipigmentatum TaxID=2893884 RepID=A0AAJ2S5L6_9FLAO|nr:MULTISPECIES: TonB-dependent receptor [unclassified Flavobacterium]MDX6181337.1 TonB-dependent receptor [Flavobacterium sp. Fl-33]MDX6184938.1 TonB-dependent receptor [Flavobacterium sp. Fl-77]UFH40030.1 TonB-dependent receptor [Flavobacterium sp. F-70]